MKHTQGEWTYSKNSHFYDINTDKKNRNLGFNILLFDNKGKSLNHTQENEANAKLIASAPELLEAVKKLRSTMNVLCGLDKVRKVIMESEGADKMLSEILDTSSSAIKKATL